MTRRLENGVLARADGLGDWWAEAHRQLGTRFLMQDFDGYFASVLLAKNSSDKLFAEFAPDGYENRGSEIRTYGWVAFFDRKRSHSAITKSANTTAGYLDLCRKIGTTQPWPPRFFFVVGSDAPPWELIEIDINTSDRIASCRLESADWRGVWDGLGLADLHTRLREWAEGRGHS